MRLGVKATPQTHSNLVKPVFLTLGSFSLSPTRRHVQGIQRRERMVSKRMIELAWNHRYRSMHWLSLCVVQETDKRRQAATSKPSQQTGAHIYEPEERNRKKGADKHSWKTKIAREQERKRCFRSEQFAAAEKVMEFRELFVWVAVMAARATRKEGSCWKERHTCGGQEPRCLEEVDPVFRLITSDEAARSAFRPNKGPATINHPTGSLRGCWIRRSRDHWIGIQFQCLLDEIKVTRTVLRGISFALSVRLCMTLFYSRLWQRFFLFLTNRSRNFCLFDESQVTLAVKADSTRRVWSFGCVWRCFTTVCTSIGTIAFTISFCFNRFWASCLFDVCGIYRFVLQVLQGLIIVSVP